MAPGTHVHRKTVGFGHCDPAGIVFYPHFFVFFHEAMESWFNTGLECPYEEVILRRKIGLPTVHARADFCLPSTLGDRLEIEVRVERLGRTSIHLGYTVRPEGGGAVRVTAATVCVVMDLDPGSTMFRRAIAVPGDLRRKIEGFAAGA